MNFLFKFGCVYKYHLSGLSTLNAVASWSLSALKSSNFVCLYTCADVWLHECMCVWGCSGVLMYEGTYSDGISKGHLVKFWSWCILAALKKKRNIPSVFSHWFIFLISHSNISCLTHSSQTLQLFHKRWGLNPLSLKLCLLVTILVNKILWT